jgi:hypothetical protein
MSGNTGGLAVEWARNTQSLAGTKGSLPLQRFSGNHNVLLWLYRALTREKAGSGCFLGPFARAARKGNGFTQVRYRERGRMFTIPYNTTLVVVGVIVVAVIGFVIYGFIKGWENVFRDE